nr:zinc finger protein CONSTANS-LIKE 4-like [Ipomoea batatas]
MGGRQGGFDGGVKRYYETGVVSSKTLSSFDWPMARPGGVGRRVLWRQHGVPLSGVRRQDPRGQQACVSGSASNESDNQNSEEAKVASWLLPTPNNAKGVDLEGSLPAVEIINHTTGSKSPFMYNFASQSIN